MITNVFGLPLQRRFGEEWPRCLHPGCTRPAVSFDGACFEHTKSKLWEQLAADPVTDSAAGVPASDWFSRYLAGDKTARKEAPIARGLFGYFPNACINVAHVSYVANAQHNPGLPMQWAFNKSTDHADCVERHSIDAASTPFDDDELLHLAKKAWRAFAELETYLLNTYPAAKPGASVTGFERGAK